MCEEEKEVAEGQQHFNDWGNVHNKEIKRSTPLFYWCVFVKVIIIRTWNYQINQHLHDLISDKVLGVIEENISTLCFQRQTV